MKNRLRFAGRLAAIHLGISLLVAAVVAALVFFVWYPHPLRQVMGGVGLFLLVVTVDVVCGPLLTLVLANPTKKTPERLLDFSLIALLQVAALCYGLYAVYQARPAVLAFEGERLRLGTSGNIYHPEWAQAQPGLDKVPFFGYLRVVARPALTDLQRMEDTELAVQGFDIGMRPSRWQDFEAGRESVKKAAKPLAELREALQEEERVRLDRSLRGRTIEGLYFLFLLAPDDSGWTAVVDEEMNLVEVVDVIPPL